MNNVTPAVADIAANATASIAGRAAQAVQTAIASNPVVAGAVAATLGIATAGAIVYYGGRWAADTAVDVVGNIRGWLKTEPASDAVHGTPHRARPGANPPFTVDLDENA